MTDVCSVIGASFCFRAGNAILVGRELQDVDRSENGWQIPIRCPKGRDVVCREVSGGRDYHLGSQPEFESSQSV